MDGRMDVDGNIRSVHEVMRTDHHHHHHFACSDPRLSTLACPSTSKPLLSVTMETVDP